MGVRRSISTDPGPFGDVVGLERYSERMEAVFEVFDDPAFVCGRCM